MSIGYKMVQQNGTSYYDSQTQYAVGALMECQGPKDGNACGEGLHLSFEKHGPMKYNARWPNCRLLECSYSDEDVLGRDDNKVRVQRLQVLRELDPWDIDMPNARRVYDMVQRVSALRPGEARVNRRKIKQLLKEHCKRLNDMDKEKRVVEIKNIKFYTPAEWASVRDSVRDSVRASVWDSVWDYVRASVRASVRDYVWASVRASVWDSVRDSVWDSVRASVWASVWASVISDDAENYGSPLVEVLECGAVLYGVDKKGVAHVIMLGKEAQ